METITLIKPKGVTPGTETNETALALLECKCPRCRKGEMFADSNPYHLQNTMKMNKECVVCKQPFDIEVGFYYGSSYISYALTVAISFITFMLTWFVFGFSLQDNNLLYWIVSNSIILIVLQPYLMRVSRTGWLAFFVRYDRNWKTNAPKPRERTNKEQENNW
jgi:hypothetical protein